jgi:hypothetical protein
LDSNRLVGLDVDDSARSDRQRRFVPRRARGRVISQPPVSFVRGLWRDFERVGDLTPCRSPMDCTGDRCLGPAFHIPCLDHEIVCGGQGLVSLPFVHRINSG